MKKQFLRFVLLFVVPVFTVLKAQKATGFNAGDIIFVNNTTALQDKIVQLATKCKYTHIGIVLPDEQGRLQVYYAAGPVKKTSIKNFLAVSKSGKYAHTRMKDTLFIKDGIAPITIEIKRLLGVPYDVAFKWTDMEMYCSEFIWKVFKRALYIELCPQKTLGILDLSNPIVKKSMNEMYGNTIPLEEKIVLPDDIFNSIWLQKVN